MIKREMLRGTVGVIGVQGMLEEGMVEEMVEEIVEEMLQGVAGEMLHGIMEERPLLTNLSI